MRKYSLTKRLINAQLESEGKLRARDGAWFKCFEMNLLSAGLFESGFNGPSSDAYFQKLSDLLTRLPNDFNGQLVLVRKKSKCELGSFRTTLIAFEQVKKIEGYSHLEALLREVGLEPSPLKDETWDRMLANVFGDRVLQGELPDVIWDSDSIKIDESSLKVLSLTELPQVTWRGCFQSIFESPSEFLLSMRIQIPDRKRIKRQLETKRRVSHALSVTSSLEVRNIESNSVLHSSEETLERILVSKETLFEISMAIAAQDNAQEVEALASDLERTVSGIGNAGIYKETIGTLPVLESHLPGGKILGIRKLPILSQNLSELLPLTHDYSRKNEPSSLRLVSRSGEESTLNLFSSENLNFNAFICGASGAGKSFLMNAILSSLLKDEPLTRLCIFDIGGSYSKIVKSLGGHYCSLSPEEARALMATYLKETKVSSRDFFRVLVQTLCGSGSHLTHSHRVAIEELVSSCEGRHLSMRELVKQAAAKPERFYQDIAHWLKPHQKLDDVKPRADLWQLAQSKVIAFDFKALDSDAVLQKSMVFLLSEIIWTDLLAGKYPRTKLVFDEVWRFFAHNQSFIEEFNRTIRKYRGGITSITQNIADYGDDAFAKMIISTSFTKIFLQGGTSADFLRNTLDFSASDTERAISVTSKKPFYSEFFALSSDMSQVLRLYPTQEFYELANTENVSQRSSI